MAKTILVGCRIPSGLMLQIRDLSVESQPVVWEHKLEGSAIDLPPYFREHGIGVTQMSENEWLTWAAWADKNKYAPFTKGHVFAAATMAELVAEARDKAKLAHGMERLDMSPGAQDPRLGEFRNGNLQAGAR